MDITKVFLFLTFCGLLGIALKRNFLNIMVSFLQVVFGINGLLMAQSLGDNSDGTLPYLTLFYLAIFIFFSYSISIVMIRSRSILNINELTEFRG